VAAGSEELRLSATLNLVVTRRVDANMPGISPTFA